LIRLALLKRTLKKKKRGKRKEKKKRKKEKRKKKVPWISTPLFPFFSFSLARFTLAFAFDLSFGETVFLLSFFFRSVAFWRFNFTIRNLTFHPHA